MEKLLICAAIFIAGLFVLWLAKKVFAKIVAAAVIALVLYFGWPIAISLWNDAKGVAAEASDAMDAVSEYKDKASDTVNSAMEFKDDVVAFQRKWLPNKEDSK